MGRGDGEMENARIFGASLGVLGVLLGVEGCA
jgi:hypothetical protein